MPLVQITLHHPASLWHAVRALTPHEGDPTTVVLRAVECLRVLNIRYVYELAQKSPTDLFGLPNFGRKSLKEVTEKLATPALTLGMTLEDEPYRAAVVATGAAHIEATRR
jgi:hypothetical protein